MLHLCGVYRKEVVASKQFIIITTQLQNPIKVVQLIFIPVSQLQVFIQNYVLG
jgi:hypothetical protein